MPCSPSELLGAPGKSRWKGGEGSEASGAGGAEAAGAGRAPLTAGAAGRGHRPEPPLSSLPAARSRHRRSGRRREEGRTQPRCQRSHGRLQGPAAAPHNRRGPGRARPLPPSLSARPGPQRRPRDVQRTWRGAEAEVWGVWVKDSPEELCPGKKNQFVAGVAER